MIWPPYAPDLTPCDLFLWGYVKDSVYAEGVPTDLAELRERIERAFDELPQKHVDKAVRAFRMRLEKCVEAEGGHIE